MIIIMIARMICIITIVFSITCIVPASKHKIPTYGTYYGVGRLSRGIIPIRVTLWAIYMYKLKPKQICTTIYFGRKCLQNLIEIHVILLNPTHTLSMITTKRVTTNETTVFVVVIRFVVNHFWINWLHVFFIELHLLLLGFLTSKFQKHMFSLHTLNVQFFGTLIVSR